VPLNVPKYLIMNDLSDLEARGVESLFGWHLSVTHKTVYARWIVKIGRRALTAHLTYLRFLEPELVSQLILPDMSPGYHCQSSVATALTPGPSDDHARNSASMSL
jgi:hypothetical protein